jgi:Thymidylate synthase
MMHTINAHDPDHALLSGLHWLKACGVALPSRNGQVLKAPGPVITAYRNPRRRVSLSPLRDANPFFHLYEAAWMLGGRNDVASVAAYAKQMAAFSDDGTTLHGAYGYRWRKFFDADQLEILVDLLRRDPTTRRAVLTMWSPYGDLFTPEGADGGLNAKDVPCNTQVYFDASAGALDMTVCNRSNDIVWGAYGANVVHMSYLHEFMSALTGLPLGTYYQFSNNYHLYSERPDVQRLLDVVGVRMAQVDPAPPNMAMYDEAPTYAEAVAEIDVFLDNAKDSRQVRGLRSFWLRDVAAPMMVAYWQHKKHGPAAALELCAEIADPAWRTAAENWLQRRAAALSPAGETR